MWTACLPLSAPSTRLGRPVSFRNAGPTDRMPLLYLLKCLTKTWTATLQPSTAATHIKDVKFHYSMILTTKTHQFPFMVQLYWTRDFGLMSLFFTPKAGVDLQNVGGTFDGLALGYDRVGTSPVITITVTAPPPPHSDKDKSAYGEKHPIHVLTSHAFGVRQRPYVDGPVLDYLPHALSEYIMHRQKRERANKDQLRYLKEKAKGWTIVYLTPQVDTLMEQVEYNDKTYSIFGVTQVFPWALHTLTECGANCESTDATFEITAPYNLEILNVIVRNEGMPIAQAIFPSETEQSYRRLYDHVKEVAKRCGFPEDILTRLPVMTDHGTGLSALAVSLDLAQNEMESG